MNTEILKLINSPAFQELTSYYNEKTMFSTLHVERNENRHSAFLGWWLNPGSEHGLGDAPLKLFLRLLATKKWGVHTFGEYYNDVLAGGYEVEVVEDLKFEKKPAFESDKQLQIGQRVAITAIKDEFSEYSDIIHIEPL